MRENCSLGFFLYLNRSFEHFYIYREKKSCLLCLQFRFYTSENELNDLQLRDFRLIA
jgi:hypothetical protein